MSVKRPAQRPAHSRPPRCELQLFWCLLVIPLRPPPSQAKEMTRESPEERKLKVSDPHNSTHQLSISRKEGLASSLWHHSLQRAVCECACGPK